MQAIMDWEKLLSSKRYGTDKPEPLDDMRSPFERDTDRVIFTSHFRRLGRKTQVHPLNENDHIHSRLSHSIETASVGRSLGLHVGDYLFQQGIIDKEKISLLGHIVHAACLAHDIGNPPFGHSGEYAIRHWFKQNKDKFNAIDEHMYCDFTCFDGNAMAFRVLTKTGFDGGTNGMRPTYAVLGAVLKYPMTADKSNNNKFSCLQLEADVLDDVARTLGLIKIDEGKYARHPLAFLTEAADDICYRIMDIEDAIELKIVDERYMMECFAPCLGLNNEDSGRLLSSSTRQRNGIIRAKMIHSAILECTTFFSQHYDEIMRGTLVESLMDISPEKSICRCIVDIYKKISENIFLSRRKVELELGAQKSISILLDTFTKPAHKFCDAKASDEIKKKIESIIGIDKTSQLDPTEKKCIYHILVMILDYISGMTDQYATEMCRKFLGIGG
ncbi:MAG: deoxyguanosinetriphosphate triphosphohydrolase [Desulfovibrionaceae bacterium]